MNITAHDKQSVAIRIHGNVMCRIKAIFRDRSQNRYEPLPESNERQTVSSMIFYQLLPENHLGLTG